tara:strand:- start:4367 stop:4609 length:243 start_codon:yes stop_codon:yes gene_type:complete
MKNTEELEAIAIPSSDWGNFHFDDEYFLNRAILDLQSQNLSESNFLKKTNICEFLRFQEDKSLRMVSTKLFPNLFLISAQ